MSDKLLRAFIEAQGYDVEDVRSRCMPIESDGTINGEHFKQDYKVTKKVDTDASQLVEHLEKVQANFLTALEESYKAGVKDARELDYAGLDCFALWEKSEVKAECDKNENI